jgi:hypothetical protein
MAQQITTLEGAVEVLKEKVFSKLQSNGNTLADIEALARVVNTLTLTREHLIITAQMERTDTQLLPGAAVSVGSTDSTSPPTEATLAAGKKFNL